VGEHLVVNFGVYFDELVRTDAGWRFRYRWLQNVYVENGSLTGQVGISRADLAAIPRTPPREQPAPVERDE
jgi:hypothetical protein